MDERKEWRIRNDAERGEIERERERATPSRLQYVAKDVGFYFPTLVSFS